MPTTPHLFSPLALRSITLRNRITLSPMCQYAARDGIWNDWHMVHLGSRAVGGAGLILTEATAVSPEGRITPSDTGLWNDEHIPGLARIAAFVHAHGASLGVQLAHAGPKACTHEPWSTLPRGSIPLDAGGWEAIGPTAAPFSPAYRPPHAMTSADLARIPVAFASAARRAHAASVRVVEIHAAHGYLLHSFHSPLLNTRSDAYGGDFAGRTRLTRAVVAAVREAWPEHLPLFVRLSCTDWIEGGWTLDESVQLALELRSMGVDLIDCSSGGAASGQTVKSMGEPLFQVPLARSIRERAEIPTGAVGLITTPQQAESILAQGSADLILLGRQFLREPYWPMHAARALAATPEMGTRFPPHYDYWIAQGG